MPGQRVLAVVVGSVAAVLGWFLTFRPFASLTVLLLLLVVGLLVMPVVRLVEVGRTRDLLAPLAYGLAALAVVTWPGSAVVVVVWVVAASLTVDGLVALVHAARGRGPGRVTAAVRGVACLVLAVLAVVWPDVTSIVVAVAFGVSLLWNGLELVWRGLGGPRPAPGGDGRGRCRHLPLVSAVTTLVLALGLAALGSLVARSVPVPDAFYTPPDDVPAEPGRLLRTDDFERKVPDGATAHRILHTTTGLDGAPAVASALVVVPDDAGDEPLPVVAWAHGTTGVARGCAPSLLDEPFESGAMLVLDEVLAQGWAFVATDYVGLGTPGPHAYLVGPPAAHAVLDSVRAAREVDGLALSDEAVVWGHSQGGHAALWAGVRARRHAPDAGVLGVAALAPASNLPGLVDSLDEVTGGSIFASYVIEGYSRTYADVRRRDHVRGAADVQVREMATRCLSGLGAVLNVAEHLTQDRSILSGDPGDGALGARLAENVPTGPVEVPVLLAQGEDDGLVTPEAQRAYVEERCAAGGGPLELRTYPGRDHVGLVAADSPLVPELLAWTAARFAGTPVAEDCG